MRRAPLSPSMNTQRLGSTAIASTLAALLTSACGGPISDPEAAPIGGALNKVTTKPLPGVDKTAVVPKLAPKAPTLEAKPIAKPGDAAPIGVVKPIELAPGKINGVQCGASCGGSCGEPDDDPPPKDLAAKPLGSTATVAGPTPKPPVPTVTPVAPVAPPQPGPIVLPPKPE